MQPPATRFVLSALPRLAAALALAAAPGAQAFSLLAAGGSTAQTALQVAARWTSPGPNVEIQVGVEPNFAWDLGATTLAQRDALNQSVSAAFAAWQSPVLGFDVTFNAAVGVGTGAGFSIDLFAVPGSDPALTRCPRHSGSPTLTSSGRAAR